MPLQQSVIAEHLPPPRSPSHNAAEHGKSNNILSSRPPERRGSGRSEPQRHLLSCHNFLAFVADDPSLPKFLEESKQDGEGKMSGNVKTSRRQRERGRERERERERGEIKCSLVDLLTAGQRGAEATTTTPQTSEESLPARLPTAL